MSKINYKIMYHNLVTEISDTIDRLQDKLLEMEEIYLMAEDDLEQSEEE